MKKNLLRKHHVHTTRQKSKVWRILWINVGIFAFLLTILTASALFFANSSHVLGAQIAMVTSDGGGGGSSCAALGKECGVNSDCCNGGSTTYCSRYGKCAKYCTQTTKSNVCYGKYVCTAVYNANRICGATDYRNCKHVNYKCGYIAPTPTPKRCTANSQCADNEICCIGNNIGSVACRGYANNTCQYAQCIGTFVDYCNKAPSHTLHFHTIANHYCQYVDRCEYGECGAQCDATHHCASGKYCTSNCQCQ